MSCICAAPIGSAPSAANPKFVQVCGAFGCELRVQKRHYKDRVASVRIDSEVRTSAPKMLTNFGIGTLVPRKEDETQLVRGRRIYRRDCPPRDVAKSRSARCRERPPLI